MTEGQWIYFESPEAAEAKESEFRAFMQPGRQVPLFWEDGVTMLEVAGVRPDGSIEFRSAQNL